jgi:hypothetical protein
MNEAIDLEFATNDTPRAHVIRAGRTGALRGKADRMVRHDAWWPGQDGPGFRLTSDENETLAGIEILASREEPVRASHEKPTRE